MLTVIHNGVVRRWDDYVETASMEGLGQPEARTVTEAMEELPLVEQNGFERS